MWGFHLWAGILELTSKILSIEFPIPDRSDLRRRG